MGWVLYHVKRFWMIRVSGLHFIPHLRSPWLTGELTRPANVRLENESQSGPQVDIHGTSLVVDGRYESGTCLTKFEELLLFVNSEAMLIDVGVLISEEHEDGCPKYLLTLKDRGWWMRGGIVGSGDPLSVAAERYCHEVSQCRY